MKRNKLLLDFCGASSVGKTSVMNALKEKLKVLPVQLYTQTSVSRPLSCKDIISENTDSYTQYAISCQNWSNIFRGLIESDIVLSTDFIIRSFAYSLCATIKNQSLIETHSNFLRFFLSDWVFKSVNVTFFYIPIEFSATPDGVRSTDPLYHKLVDTTIKEIYKKYSINYVTLSGSIEERTASIIDNISPYLLSIKKDFVYI